MRAVGVDLGLNCSMVALDDLLNSKVVRLVAEKDFSRFIKKFYSSALKLIKGVDLVVVERPFVRGYANVLIEMLGVLRLGCVMRSVDILVISPVQLKKFVTGKGGAHKSDMVLALYKEFGRELDSEDSVDAWWMAYLGLSILGGVEVSKKYRKEVVQKLGGKYVR